MVSVQEQYEAYPYPERKPEDEKKRMVTGSPSYPEEIDHFLHGGARDWSQPFRALVAGGGTGDALIQMAQVLTSAGRPYELTYLDLSSTSRQIAEARAEMRGLTGITFHTGSLLDAADLGSFDYIDCCGVLHHLPNPAEGFAALRSALAPGGGMGFMVYAPYGRSGVYPLQEAFGALLDGLPPKARLERAREIVRKLPPGHPFRCNPNLRDHRASEAGFYDLLLHSQDQAFDVASLLQVLDDTGWQLLSFATPALYDLARITGKPADNDRPDSWTIAEKLCGAIKIHVAYAVPKGDTRQVARGNDRSLVPHLRNMAPTTIAKAVAQGQQVPLKFGQITTLLTFPKSAARVIAAIDGRRSLSQIAAQSGLDPIVFGSTWAKVESELADWGLLRFSRVLV